MHANAARVTRFYTAFAQLDADTMASCYADQVCFKDAVFALNGKAEVMGMWRMLTDATRAKGRDVWKLEFSQVTADDHVGAAHWDAHYRFSTTGRMVLNRIDARFEFNKDGLIAGHQDSFNFWRWSQQALGAPGLLLGWTPFLRNKVKTQANANLTKYLAAHS